MTVSRFVPPLDYLQTASRGSLQSFELARLNHAANLRREIAALIDQWITETSEAMLARWMLDHNKPQQSCPQPAAEVFGTLIDSATALFPGPHSTCDKIIPAPPRYATPRPSLKGTLGRKPQKQKQSAVG